MADISTSTGWLLDGLLTCAETARQLGRSERQIKRMARAGLLELVRIGRRDYYDVAKSRARLRGEFPPPAPPRRGRPRTR